MGTSGDLQYVLPILLVAIAINYSVVNLEAKRIKYLGYIIICCYTGVKITLYKILNLNSDLIAIHIVAFVIINLSFIFRNKIWSKEIEDRKKLIWDLNFATICGYIMFIILFYIFFNERMYINGYNLIIMATEYILVGFGYIISSKYMIKYII